ncbi:MULTISPECIES: pirin family protein [unclassified Massilia]|uniref:pirin family protein n=1 Tax=unclassified Massilia TaxID=2609279 RepID=UPI001B8101EC|nr:MULTISPECIES: pirin family protein [unclassified Massilia]MBQ5942369.1 pirin family protein [Massilia sp. AB1]MBQ5963981.1 pirin family protein [Massilia sp. ZL223]
MSDKSILRIHPAQRDDIGDLVTRRPLPGPLLERIDPFLFLNHHGPQTYPPHNRGLPFGPHPHRGFETVTFIVEGSLAHRDNAGHESVIRAGGVQWMTAGSGIVHAEVSPRDFLDQGGPVEILQLWVNLPSRLKMSAPAYVGLQEEEIPALPLDEGKVTLHLIAGQWESTPAPIQSLTGVFMSTLEMRAGGHFHAKVAPPRKVFLYVVRGSIAVGRHGDLVNANHLVELGDDGEAVDLHTESGALLLFGHAEPIREPVVAHGPFVMTTRAEIAQAVADYQAGRFGSALG